MKYAIISDLHSNIEALKAVRMSIEEEGVDGIVCLGDIIGYGADPVECISLLRDMDPIVSLMGNHDHASIGLTDIEYFNLNAREAIVWTRENLGDEELRFLGTLPMTGRIDGAVLVHGSLESPLEWNYILTEGAASRCFDLMDEDICFIGHSHSPIVFGEETHLIPENGAEIQLVEGKNIVNDGSVGQPRDGDPRSRYVIYDSSRRTVSYRAVEYDIERTRAKIIEAGLPRALGDRLIFGH